MNEMNTILIFVLISVLIYAVYKYQNQIMALTGVKLVQEEKAPVETKPAKPPKKKNKKISLDNISQISINSEKEKEKEESINFSFLDDNSKASKDSFF